MPVGTWQKGTFTAIIDYRDCRRKRRPRLLSKPRREIQMLENQSKFFDEHKAEWLEKHRDRVVLIKGRELVGFFDNERDAVVEGARRFGLQSFMAKRVQESEEEVFIPALAMGILGGDI